MNDPKTPLRQRLRLARRELSQERVATLSSAIVRHVVAARFYQQAHTIGLYLPIDNEVDPTLLLDHAASSGKSVFLPIAEQSTRSLCFVPYHPGAPLRTGAFGILEPIPSDQHPVMRDMSRMDLVFQPLIGFDHTGGRLGYGGGYYDRALARPDGENAGTPLLIGLAYGFQELPAVPREPHDRLMHGVVTEAGVLLV